MNCLYFYARVKKPDPQVELFVGYLCLDVTTEPDETLYYSL